MDLHLAHKLWAPLGQTLRNAFASIPRIYPHRFRTLTNQITDQPLRQFLFLVQ